MTVSVFSEYLKGFSGDAEVVIGIVEDGKLYHTTEKIILTDRMTPCVLVGKGEEISDD